MRAADATRESARRGPAKRERREGLAARVLIAAGLEPTARVGLLVDVATVTGLGARALGVATALTAQGAGAARVEAVRPVMLRAQLAAAVDGGPPAVVKLGLVPDLRALRVLTAGLRAVDAEWVVDPVVRSSSGAQLSALRPRDYLSLAAPRVVLTPNAVEAGWLLGAPAPRNLVQAERAALRLLDLGFGAIVLKGGHLQGEAADVIATADDVMLLRGARLKRTRDHRGTGCRFASAFAAHRALGADLRSAARAAQNFVRQYIGIIPETSR